MLPTPVKLPLKPLIILLFLAGAVLRIAGIFDDFWLDEIWSWRIARSMQALSDVFLSSEARYDNNHPLNTVFMYATGDLRHWWIWRVPALLAGIGSIALAADITRHRGRVECFLAALLFALSYPLIFFSSEARGYSLVVFFALASIDALDRYLRRPTILLVFWFWAACLLGFLSHLTFIHAYAAMLIWSIFHLRREERISRDAPGRIVSLHLVPVAIFCVLYFVFIRHITIGGSPPTRTFGAIVEAIGELFGSGSSRDVAIATSVLAGAFLIWIIFTLAQAKSDWWILLLVACVISPALILTWQLNFVQPRQPIAARYFLVPYSVLLLGASLALARIDRRAIAVIAITFVTANLWQTARYLNTGRGNYSQAVNYMSAQTSSPVITVLADDPTRTSMVLDFYAPRVLPAGQRLVIYDVLEDSDPRLRQRPAPMWVIIHNNQHHAPPSESAGAYILDRDFDFYGLSGYSWYLYRAPEHRK